MALSEKYDGLRVFTLQTADVPGLTTKLGELGIQIAAQDKSVILVRTDKATIDSLVAARDKKAALFTITDNQSEWAKKVAAQLVPA